MAIAGSGLYVMFIVFSSNMVNEKLMGKWQPQCICGFQNKLSPAFSRRGPGGGLLI
jgi:hypothetical protein